MAVSEQTPYIEHVANGITTSFALEFDCDNRDHLIVLVDDVESVVGAWSLSNGAVVFNTAPENGKKITLHRNTPFSRTTDYQSYNNSFRPPAVNKDFDWIWWKLQELGVADMLLKIYVDRLHGEQKDYIDNKDQLVRSIIADLRNYVNQQDSSLSSDIDNLRTYVDQQDNSRNSYFENLISQQGVSLQQLDIYYNHLLQGIANIATEKGWLASLIVDKSGKTQQQINDSIAVKFLLAKEIGLTKWSSPDKQPPYTQQEYEQAYRNGINFAAAVKKASDQGFSIVILERGDYPVLLRNELGLTNFNKILEIGSSDLRSIGPITIDYNGANFFTIFDSNNKNQYNPSAASYAAYQLAGTLLSLWDSRGVTFRNGKLIGDQYKRSWVAGENMTEQTFGITCWRNNRNIRFENMKFTGFRGDGVSGKPRGTVLENYAMYEWSKGDIDAAGNLVALVGAYSSARIDLRLKTIIDNMVQLEAHADRLLTFRSNLIKVSFFKADYTLIAQELSGQSLDITLPRDCAFIQFTAFNDERTTETVTYSTLNYGTALATGTSKGFYFDERCEFYENHRGGVSNLGGDSFFFGCKFYNMGQLSKLGFPNYGDPTQYAINFEDTYTSSLTVDGIRVSNVTQGVLSNSREFTVKNSKFLGMIHGGVNNYSCIEATIDGNTFSGFRSQNSGAVSFSTGDNKAQSTAKVINNTFTDASLRIDISGKPNMQLTVDNNTMAKGRWVLIGNGENLTSTNNTIKNVRGSGLNSPAYYQKDLLQSSGNKLLGLPMETSNIYIEHSVDSGVSNSITLEGTQFKLNNSGDDLIAKRLNAVRFKSRTSATPATLVLETGERSLANTHDKWLLENLEFKGAVLNTVLGGTKNYRDSTIEIVDSDFKNGAYIGLSKAETVSTGKTIYIIKDTRFDVSTLSQVFLNRSPLLGTCEVYFINCTFVSSTLKSLPFIRGQLAGADVRITAQAIGCRFVNVTNTDSILQIINPI